MRKWLTTFILIAAMLGGLVGVGAHEGEGACPMANLPDCCKKAQSNDNAPEVSMARLCCSLNCSEPGSSGSNASSFSRQQGIAPNAFVIPRAGSFNGIGSSCHKQTPHKPDSNPKYIRNLALLI
jgi:hypothetical protein